VLREQIAVLHRPGNGNRHFVAMGTVLFGVEFGALGFQHV
jgi:hypothetical protein